jgi:hypothetical protein
MDYEKKYKEALSRAKELMSRCVNNRDYKTIIYRAEDIESIFPELNESEDERIRKAILEGLIDCRDAPDLGWSNFGGIEIDDCISWLEKQGEKPQGKTALEARTDNELVEEVYSHLDSIKETTDRMTSGNFMHNKAAIKFSANTITKVLELIGIKAQKDSKYDNQNCVKPTDKVEPKFKVGDYVTNGHFECEIESVDDTTYYCDFTNFDIKDQDNLKLVEKETDFKFELNFNYSVGQWIVACGKKVFLITKIDGFNITLVDTNGDESVFDVSSLNDARPWTIQDTKGGDVLASKDGVDIVIFRNFDSSTSFSSYYNIAGRREFDWSNDSFIPATKEQRDLLFQEFKEAGVEWDIEKKELKKEVK